MNQMQEFLETYGVCEYGREVLSQHETPYDAWHNGCVQTCLYFLRKLNYADADAQFKAAEALLYPLRENYLTNYAEAYRILQKGRYVAHHAKEWNAGMADLLTDVQRADIALATSKTLEASMARRTLYFAADYALQTLGAEYKFRLADVLRQYIPCPEKLRPVSSIW